MYVYSMYNIHKCTLRKSMSFKSLISILKKRKFHLVLHIIRWYYFMTNSILTNHRESCRSRRTAVGAVDIVGEKCWCDSRDPDGGRNRDVQPACSDQKLRPLIGLCFLTVIAAVTLNFLSIRTIEGWHTQWRVFELNHSEDGVLLPSSFYLGNQWSDSNEIYARWKASMRRF